MPSIYINNEYAKAQINRRVNAWKSENRKSENRKIAIWIFASLITILYIKTYNLNSEECKL